MVEKTLKVIVGTACAIVAAELVAIGANAAFDDGVLVGKELKDRFSPSPEPVPKRTFGVFKKRGK